MRRFLARRAIVFGRPCGLSVVSIDGTDVSVEPFVRETAFTEYVDGTLVVDRGPGADAVVIRIIDPSTTSE